jgi:diguanylate cyclase (GGDEF)-like protein
MGDIVMVNVVDISDRRRYLDRLSHLADHDVLTGLANRRRFETELQRHLERCGRHGPTGALLLLDLDNFKQVNDTLGHNAGDELLITIAGLLRRSIRGSDLVARLGGDEFAVLLTEGGQEAAQRVAGLVVERVRDHAATLDGVGRRVTASVGAVTFKAASEHSADVLALADMTMYDAKEAGRNQVAVLPEGDERGPRTAARLHWQSRIEAALEEDRFELHLQPIMNIATGRISSAEVLLRMRDQGELVPPSRFVYIAERVGLMPRVDAWVVDHSLALLARMRAEHDPEFEFEVNLSGHSIGNPEIEQALISSLATHGVEPAALILEITETAAVADVAMARDFAARMTDLGCAFALDDFGAGFGSFYYLKHLFFDYVKIDGEFVAHVHESQVDRTIMRSIVGIAHDLGKRTVAEFVSAPEILEVCREEGVDFAQGYLIGKPVPYDEFVGQFMTSAVGAAPKD